MILAYSPSLMNISNTIFDIIFHNNKIQIYITMKSIGSNKLLIMDNEEGLNRLILLKKAHLTQHSQFKGRK
jgi:hypothetical protein